MKKLCRHAAALALVGWYLMVLPQDDGGAFLHGAPLYAWTRKATFDTEADCKLEISKGCHRFENGATVGLVGPLCYSMCVRSDDPRLKGK